MLMFMISLMLCLLTQTAQPAPPSDLPAAPGVYHRQDGARWAVIEPAVIADTKTKGMDLFLETGGFYSPDLTVIYQGAQAPTPIPETRPVFYVRGIGSAKDAVIVLLTRKKDSRTLQTSAAAAASDNKGGFVKKDIRNVTVTVFSDNSFAVTPDDPLKPGEYLLLLGLAHAGFDFGVPRGGK
jgi:hypothetical protein